MKNDTIPPQPSSSYRTVRWLGLFDLRVRRCDNCGKINPPHFDGNPRLCGACAVPGGFYRRHGETSDPRGDTIGANGKINYWRLRFPITLQWRGWWTL